MEATNLSKIKRNEMIGFLEHLKKRNNDDESIKAINEIINQLNNTKYGLVWEHHQERVDIELINNIPIFTEVKEKCICDNSSNYNFLLEGDNLHSLYLLEKTHREKIDLIYIDPPYNTGNRDFIYNDETLGKDDAFKHSKWLSFMEHRLRIANNLLSKKGAIFISIDDNELAQLKMLCDEIFEEKNFVGCICRATGTTTGQDANKIGSSLDYCLVYSKSQEFTLKGMPLNEKDLKRFKDEDEKGKYSVLQLRKTGNEDRKENRPNMFYPVIAPDGTEVYPFGPSNYLSRWRVSQETYNDLLKDDMIVWKKKTNYKKINIDGFDSSPWTPYVKYYAEGRTKQVSNLFQEIEGNKKASLDLKNILGKEIKFDYPKPVEFIKILLKIAGDSKSTVLDFFAGSGTTGQAVLEANKEDGGNRKFILCTNNENNICEEITYQRLKTVITGKRKDNSDFSDGIKAGLKYYITDWTPRKPEDYMLSNVLLLHIKEMIELENAIEIDNEKNVIIFNKDDFNQYISNEDNYKKISNIWVNQNIIFTGEELQKLNKKEFKYIPKEFFGQELKEAAE